MNTRDWAVADGRLFTELVEISHEPAVLDGDHEWIVVATFEGELTLLRFAQSSATGSWWDGAPAWHSPSDDLWTSSMDRATYEKAVEAVREEIAAGVVYQVNVCRVLSALMPQRPDLRALGAALHRGNPAPYAAVVSAPSADVSVACASPELYLHRDGDIVESGPIKGTASTPQQLLEKDRAENVMIVDLVRNDLSRVAVTGSVTVPSLLRVEEHPGLVHLVSTVRAELVVGTTWPELLGATFPPGSVTGAPKSSAIEVIRRLEPVPRGVYCGAVGVAGRGRATLAVAIRTYEWRDGRLHLGTGAGITWGSDPAREWEETELKVRRLLEVR